MLIQGACRYCYYLSPVCTLTVSVCVFVHTFPRVSRSKSTSDLSHSSSFRHPRSLFCFCTTACANKSACRSPLSIIFPVPSFRSLCSHSLMLTVGPIPLSGVSCCTFFLILFRSILAGTQQQHCKRNRNRTTEKDAPEEKDAVCVRLGKREIRGEE
jgi:hypothetical protein